jgi:Holliday junction resolvasome RuvABC endonuclease subunit
MAIHLNGRGYGFAVFEGYLAPIDWGVVEVRAEDKRVQIAERVRSQLARYVPDVLVVQNMLDPYTRRTHRIRRLNERIIEVAEDMAIVWASYSRTEVRKCFAYLGAVNKDQIAAAIARHIPEFERFLPRPRKPWMSEDARMGIFDAAALVLTYFQANGQWGG